MRQFITLTKRHIQLFFTEKSNVVFTCLSSIIVLALYIMFLMDLQVENIQYNIPNIAKDTIYGFLGYWLLAGQIVLVIFASTFSAMGQYISDMEYNKSDAQIFPMGRAKLLATYCVQAVIVGVFFVTLSSSVGMLFIYLQSGYVFPVEQVPMFGLTLFVGVVFSSVIAMLCVFLVSTIRAYGSLQTLINTLMGFLIGLYISPVNFSQFVQEILPWNPYMSIVTVLRNILTKDMAHHKTL